MSEEQSAEIIRLLATIQTTLIEIREMNKIAIKQGERVIAELDQEPVYKGTKASFQPQGE